ncbi:MAG: hypothetical protein WHS86_07215 [Desulfosoma sp.]
MFTKLLFLRVVLPLLILATALGLAPFPWAQRLRAKIRFGTLMRRFLILVACLGILAYGVDFLINKTFHDREDLRLQRQGGRTGTLPPPTHGRPLRTP